MQNDNIKALNHLKNQFGETQIESRASLTSKNIGWINAQEE